MDEDDKLRQTKIQEASGARLQEIKKYMEGLRAKQNRVKEFQIRIASEEREKISQSLATVDEKIKTRRNRNDDFLNSRISSVKMRNERRSDRLLSHRISEHQNKERAYTNDQDRQKQ